MASSTKPCSLFLDTAVCLHLAVLDKEGNPLFKIYRRETKGLLENLPDAIQILENFIKNENTQIVRMLLGIGPGSFTGLRVGIAFAMGYSKGKWPIYTFSSLKGMVLSLGTKKGGALIAARKGFFYYSGNAAGFAGFESETTLGVEELGAFADKLECLSVPHYADEYGPALAGGLKIEMLSMEENYLYFNLQKHAMASDPVSGLSIRPNYVEPSAAERKWKGRVK